MYGIPVPRYACVNRTVPNQDLDYFVEEEDFVEVNGERFWKPFVEKPVNGELASGSLFTANLLSIHPLAQV